MSCQQAQKYILIVFIFSGKVPCFTNNAMILDSDVENLKPKGYWMMNCQYDGVKVQFKLLSSQIQYLILTAYTWKSLWKSGTSLNTKNKALFQQVCFSRSTVNIISSTYITITLCLRLFLMKLSIINSMSWKKSLPGLIEHCVIKYSRCITSSAS